MFGVWKEVRVMRYEYILFLLSNGNRYLMNASAKEMQVGEAVSSGSTILYELSVCLKPQGSSIVANISSENTFHIVSSKEVPH